MLSSASAIALCLEDNGIEVVLSRELFGKGLPPDVAGCGIFDDIIQGENVEVILQQRKPAPIVSGKRKRKGYYPREYEPRTPKEESNWWRHYLCFEKRTLLEIAEEKRAADEPIPLAARKVFDGFVSAFRVSWSVFLELKKIVLERGFYD